MSEREDAAYFGAFVRQFNAPTDDSPVVFRARISPGHPTTGWFMTLNTNATLTFAGTKDWPNGLLDVCGQLVGEEPDESEHAHMVLDGIGIIKAYGARLTLPDAVGMVECGWPFGSYPSRVEMRPGLWTPRHFATAERALRWLEGIGRERGRPRGSGAFPDEIAFRSAVEPVVREIRASGEKPTRDRVADRLGIHTEHLRECCRNLLGIDWRTFADSVA